MWCTWCTSLSIYVPLRCKHATPTELNQAQPALRVLTHYERRPSGSLSKYLINHPRAAIVCSHGVVVSVLRTHTGLPRTPLPPTNCENLTSTALDCLEDVTLKVVVALSLYRYRYEFFDHSATICNNYCLYFIVHLTFPPKSSRRGTKGVLIDENTWCRLHVFQSCSRVRSDLTGRFGSSRAS